MAEETPTPAGGAGQPVTPPLSDPFPAANAADAADPPTSAPSSDAAAASPPAEAMAAAGPAPPPEAAELPSEQMLDQLSIDELLKQASFEDPSALGGSVAAPEAANLHLPNFQQVMQDAQVSSIDLLRAVELNVKIELGRARMFVEDVLKLSEGSVVELDKLAGDPVDVFVNDRLVARGEVLVLNDNFCVRVNEIVAGVKEEGM